MNLERPLAFAQLLRLPNVFTAFADVCLAAAAAGYITSRPDVFALMLAGSGCLYLGGMVWNDFFDRKEDAKTRPQRPIPSGRVSPGLARVLGLTLTGIGFAALVLGLRAAHPDAPTLGAPVLLPAGLVVAILLYDVWLKHAVIGPIGMGMCRFLNMLIALYAGLELDQPLPYHLAAVIGVYIVGVTWFARTEEGTSQRWQLIAAAVVMGLAVLLGSMLPMHLEPGRSPIYFPYLLAGFAFVIGFPVVAAVRQPTPRHVQAAVKRCILGLIVFDAVLATAFVGWPGLLIALLLLPALLLGKWVYST